MILDIFFENDKITFLIWKDDEREVPGIRNEPEFRFREKCVGALQRKIFKMLKRLQKMKMEIKKESQRKMKQRLKMYDANLDEEELKELIKDPEVIIFFLLCYISLSLQIVVRII